MGASQKRRFQNINNPKICPLRIMAFTLWGRFPGPITDESPWMGGRHWSSRTEFGAHSTRTNFHSPKADGWLLATAQMLTHESNLQHLLKFQYYTTRWQCDNPLQAVLKICLFLCFSDITSGRVHLDVGAFTAGGQCLKVRANDSSWRSDDSTSVRQLGPDFVKSCTVGDALFIVFIIPWRSMKVLLNIKNQPS